MRERGSNSGTPWHRRQAVQKVSMYLPVETAGRLLGIADASERSVGQLLDIMLKHGGFDRLEKLPSTVELVEQARSRLRPVTANEARSEAA